MELYYETYGQGPADYMATATGLRRRRKIFRISPVIAVDSWTHGQSVDPGDLLSFEMMATDFAILLAAHSLDTWAFTAAPVAIRAYAG